MQHYVHTTKGRKYKSAKNVNCLKFIYCVVTERKKNICYNTTMRAISPTQAKVHIMKRMNQQYQPSLYHRDVHAAEADYSNNTSLTIIVLCVLSLLLLPDIKRLLL